MTTSTMKGICAVLLLLLVVQGAWGQEAGRITGSVRIDRTDAPVVGVNVVVVGTLYGAVTDERGAFVVDAVPPGRYVVAINALGYRPAQQSVNVEAGGTVVVDFRLQPPEAQLDAIITQAVGRALGPHALVETRRIREVNALDTGGLLRLLPGSGAMRGNAFGLQPRIRGLWEPQIGIVVDGAPFAPGSPYGMGTPLDLVDPASIETIDVVQGPYALTWGPGMLSAIQITSRGSDPSPGPLASAQGAYTSNLGVLEGIGAVSGVAAGVGFRGFGALRAGNDYDDGSGAALRADYRSINMGGLLGYDVGPAARLSMTGGYQDQRGVDTPGRIFDLDNSQAAHLAARFQQAFSTGVVRGLDGRVSWNHLAQRVTDEGRDVLPQRTVVDGTHSQLGARLAAQMLAVGRWPMEVGGDVNHTTQAARQAAPGNDVFLPASRLTQAGLFASVTPTLGRVEASGTVRVDFVEAYSEIDTEAPSEANLSGAATFRVSLSEQWHLGLGGGSVVRTADVVERYAVDLPFRRTHRFSVQGTPTLKPERSTQADVWLEANYPRLHLRGDIFARRIHDFITATPTFFHLLIPPQEEPVVIRYTNSAATYYGGEASAFYQLVGDFVTLHADAQYVWGEDDETGGALIGMPPLRGSLGARVQAPANIFFLEGVVHGAARQTRIAADRGETETDGYVTADLRFGLSLPRTSYLLLGIDNVTGTRYADPLNPQTPSTWERLAEPGGRFYARLRVLL